MAWRVAWALLLLAGASLPLQVVHAQGFFQYFFGPEPPPRPRPYPAYPGAGPFSPYFGDNLYVERPPTYRTLCVRLCDGYYFPISFATMRSEFARDADKCAASCGSEARLFYHPNPGGDVEGMTDLTGMAYAALPNAFKYRKTLVDDCSCRPQPWSEAEQERHRSYAASPRPRTDDSASRTAASEARARAGLSYGLPYAPRGNGNLQGLPFPPRRGPPPGGVFR
jgi:Protein of unknown function (DUF2865).